MRNIITYLSLLVFFMIFQSCSSLRSVPENDTLYVGANVKLENRGDLTAKGARELEGELKALTRPQPNSKVLGLPIKLWFYGVGGKRPAKNRIGKFIQTKLGEPPVLGSSVNIEKNRKLLVNRLENRGFFKATMTADTTVKRRRMTVNYKGNLGYRYKIAKIDFPKDSSVLSQHIAATAGASILQTGDYYSLENIIEERRRIDGILKEQGFFYFNPEYLIINVDSTIGNHTVNLYVQPKEETPIEARDVYRIKDVVVYADYELNEDTLFNPITTPKVRGIYIVDPEKRFRPRVFDRTLIFAPGDIYKRSDHNLTLNRLQTLGVYKYVKVRFDQSDTTGNYLDAFYYLTRLPKRTVRAEVSALTKTNNAGGSEISVSWRDRNLWKSAELLTLTAFVGAERQYASQSSVVSTYRTGFDVNLYVPRIIAPFRFNTNSGFVPKTRFNLGYELFNRTSQYTLTTFKGLAGYTWKESFTREHELNLVYINLIKAANITEDFQKRIDTNITLRRTIEPQFIFGSMYNFNYNSQIVPNNNRSQFYFNGNLESSGGLINLLTKSMQKNGDTLKIFNAPVSQFVRAEIDGRHYWHLGGDKANQFATRLIVGAGRPYGGTKHMPFTRSFFIGGTSSLRGFRARSVGPGTYYGGTAIGGRFLPDQPGDYKLEFNNELRAKLFSIVNGAIFVDAGNIWTAKKDPTRPGAEFTNRFLKQLAVDAGFGLRFDLNFIVIRGDIAFPLRKPWQVGNEWVGGEIDFFNKDWRKENLIFNLAIGYPF
jgi:outer membrane protein insertion porin family